MTASNKAAAQLAVSKVNVDGGTNLSGGLFKGVDQHQQVSPSPGTVTEQSDIATGQFLACKHRHAPAGAGSSPSGTRPIFLASGQVK